MAEEELDWYARWQHPEQRCVLPFNLMLHARQVLVETLHFRTVLDDVQNITENAAQKDHWHMKVHKRLSTRLSLNVSLRSGCISSFCFYRSNAH